MIKAYLQSKSYHNKVASPVHLLKKFPELKDMIKTDLPFNGQLYCIINNIEYPICMHCGKPYRFISFKKGFLKNCDNECNKNIVMYNNHSYIKNDGKVLVCNKHHRYVSEKVFYGLVEHKVECMCEVCSLDIRSFGNIDEQLVYRSKQNLKELFKDRKKLSLNYLMTYYPHFYIKVESIKDIYPKNIFNKMNAFLYDIDLSCKDKNCKNKVSFDKLHHPKEYCNQCSHKIGLKKSNDKHMLNFWSTYIQDNFKDKVKILEIGRQTITLQSLCEHNNTITIRKLTLKGLKSHGIVYICRDCAKSFYLNDISNKEYDYKLLLQNMWESIKQISIDQLFNRNPYLWAFVFKHMDKFQCSFAEAKYMLNYNIDKRPKCLSCKNDAIFSNEAYGYLYHCEEHKFAYVSSKPEKDISDFLAYLNINHLRNQRNLINGELDIYIPDKKIAIEFNGLYWHSDRFKNKNYHYNKWKACKDVGIFLLTVWEDDWINKQDIIKSIIKNALNLSSIRIGARECDIRTVNNFEKTEFLKQNHLQGNCQSSINLGLYYKDDLVSLMTFGSKRKILGSTSNSNEYELLRFCSKIDHQVNGAASRLFKYFNDEHHPISITSYASCDISNGGLYEKLGFAFSGHTGTNYWWEKEGIRYHRSNFMKHKLVKEGADTSKSESEIMIERGFNKIYGAGNLKYIFLQGV
jgi:hypothetical protein